MIGEGRSSFLQKIRPYKDDKKQFDSDAKEEPIKTYFRERVAVIRPVLPQVRDEPALISIALSTSQESTLIATLPDYPNSSFDNFQAVCEVEYEERSTR